MLPKRLYSGLPSTCIENMHELKNITALGNVKLAKDYVLCTVNPKIYPLYVVQSAAYIMIDKAYILLDGNPEKEIKVEIRQKNNKISLPELAQEFNEQLLNYSVYAYQSEKNRQLREAILMRVLMTNAPEKALEQFKKALKDEKNNKIKQEFLQPGSH